MVLWWAAAAGLACLVGTAACARHPAAVKGKDSLCGGGGVIAPLNWDDRARGPAYTRQDWEILDIRICGQIVRLTLPCLKLLKHKEVCTIRQH